MSGKMMLFSGTSHPQLAKEIAELLGTELGEVTIEKFANNEIYVRFLDSVRGAELFLIQSLCGDVNESLMELLIMIDAAKRASAESICVVIPHFAYARQDKKSAAREPISARLVADLLTVAGANRIITMDLHQGQIQGFFDMPVNHLTALGVLADYFAGLNLEDPVVVSPDVGRAKVCKKLADMLDVPLAIMHKGRPEHNVAEITSVIGDVDGKICIVTDDMIDTAGTITAGAKALMDKGAKAIYLGATHAVLSPPARERIRDSVVVDCVVTNTIAIPEDRTCDKLTILSVAPMFAAAIKNVYNDGSVSALFDPDFEF
ncbi:MAG: ribose-phosphate pyrophosphokinase [Coriobacteriia bacterium]|nr:ribose-phosphate pyrophosphokinase [Coriobacteriia bacterium]MCL2537420.1 ribose-phosphate pyrophosphokinase [Coriobacteriia bacterium]